MKAQHKDGWYTVRCDFVLHNNSTEEELYKQGKALAVGLKPQKKKASNEVRTTVIALALTLGTIGFISFGYHMIYRYMYPQKYSETVTACAEEFGLDEELIYAVISCESGFDPEAVSSADARGLMQLTEDAFDWVQFRLGEDGDYADIFDPEVNIRAGSAMLSLLIEELGDERSAVAAYHSGLNQVKEWLADTEYSEDGKRLDIIPTPNTREYADRVDNARHIYENLYD
ncbi:MAG: lytic transglycosylase domain-containing protein [Oscillospiraceae bacterium]|nr:lytic transglycosylase domain-containing protein [Oscillospiraceae bacterium]